MQMFDWCHKYNVSTSITHSTFTRYRFPSGRPRPYSLDLGRRIKQRLWEKLNCPMFTETETIDGLVTITESSCKGPYPPLIHVDVYDEPAPPKMTRELRDVPKHLPEQVRRLSPLLFLCPIHLSLLELL